MKKFLIVLITFFLLVSNYSEAQTGIKLGFKFGYNLGTQYGIKDPTISYDVHSASRHGFTAGILLNFPISDAFSVQQEFLYSQKGSRQDVSQTQPTGPNTFLTITTNSKYNIDYFELPILFRYNFVNIGNVKIFGSSGFALSVLLNGKYTIDGNIDTGQATIPIQTESGKTDGLDTFDYSFIYGLGMEFNLLKQKLFFDYRQTIGWNTLMMPNLKNPTPAAPVPLRNQTYSFSLGIFL